MFLATTSDQKFWKKGEQILFLGEWCRIFSQKHVWSKLDYEVLPYCWEDRDRYYRDFLYLDEVYERYLEELSKSLNSLHNEKRSIRYWRMVVSPWLYYFIEVFYDRYLSIRTAIDSGKVKKTWVPPLMPEEYVPKDFATFEQWHIEDSYNQCLYGWIIRKLGGISYEIKNDIPQLIQFDTQSRLRYLSAFKKTAKKLLGCYAKIIPKDWGKVVFVSSYLKPMDLSRLQLALGQLPNPCSSWPEIHYILPNSELRQEIKLPPGQSEFETLLNELIPLQMPTVYIEKYAEMCEIARSEFPQRPKLIMTANAYTGNEGFNFWAADQVECGAKLVGMPHGGHYGASLWSSNESHEIRIADKYYTWGWADTDNPKTVPFVTGQLAGTKKNIQHDPNGQILWLGLSRPRYSTWTFSAPVGSQILEYIEDQIGFIEALFPQVKDLLTMRSFPKDFGWEVKERLAERLPSLRFDSREKTMYQQLCKSRLCIGTYNATTNLETLSANFPTVAFWDFDQWKLRESAKPYFDDMLEAGIFHTNPESAARKVNEIYEDPVSWWNSPMIKEARTRFCQRFARTSENWIYEWKEEIQKIIGE